MRLRRDPEAARQFDHAWQPRLYVLLVGLALVVAYIIGFIVANSDRVSVNFVFFDARTSLIWLILLCFGSGLVAGVLLSQLYRRRNRAARE
jgi:uncharacterized integral membrane protein